MADAMAWGKKFEALGERVTPHTLMVDGWQNTMERHQQQAEEIRDELIELRQAELRGEAFLDTREELSREHEKAQVVVEQIRKRLEKEGRCYQ